MARAELLGGKLISELAIVDRYVGVARTFCWGGQVRRE